MYLDPFTFLRNQQAVVAEAEAVCEVAAITGTNLLQAERLARLSLLAAAERICVIADLGRRITEATLNNDSATLSEIELELYEREWTLLLVDGEWTIV